MIASKGNVIACINDLAMPFGSGQAHGARYRIPPWVSGDAALAEIADGGQILPREALAQQILD